MPSVLIGKDSLSRIMQSLHYDARLTMSEMSSTELYRKGWRRRCDGGESQSFYYSRKSLFCRTVVVVLSDSVSFTIGFS